MDSFNDKEIKYIAEHYTEFSPDWHLRPPQVEGIRWKQVLPQMEARKKASEKLADWTSDPNLIFPVRLSVEQCSSQKTALWKQDLLRHRIPDAERTVFTDLTGGFGVDCWYISRIFKEARYVERDPQLCEIAGHNFARLGGTPISIYQEETESFLSRGSRIGGTAFIDPARRNELQQKLVALSDCTPNLIEIAPLLTFHFDCVLVKLSPMLDISLALRQLPHCGFVEVWAVQKECKELIVFLDFKQSPPAEIPITAKHEGYADFTFTREAEKKISCPTTAQVQTYLYEPNIAILKAGAFQTIGHNFGLFKLHKNSHLYTSDQLIPDFPGRKFRILTHFGCKSAEVKTAMQGIDCCELTVRNFPLKAPEVRKKYRLRDGGKLTLFATTLASGEHRFLLCEKI